MHFDVSVQILELYSSIWSLEDYYNYLLLER